MSKSSPRSTRVPAIVVLCSLLGLVAACDDAPPAEAPRVAEACVPDAMGHRLTSDEVLASGPYSIGTLDLTFVDTSRVTPAHGPNAELPERTLSTKVWFPAAPGGATVASGGPFPIVAYSHGFSSFNNEGSLLNEHLASLGYVVVAPGFPLSGLTTPGGPTGTDIANQPLDIRFVIDSMLAKSATPGDLFEGAVDASRVASVGLSMGGLTSLLVGYHATLRDPRVSVVVAMAPSSDILGDTFYDTRIAPLLVLSGDIDAIVDYEANARATFDRANAPVNLYTLENGTHTGFTSTAIAFEAEDNADTIGCAAISMAAGGGGGTPFDIVAALGGSAAGIVPGGVDGDCMPPLPYGMRPSRQSQIEILAISSFLESYLSSDATVRGRSCDFHERVLSKEGDVRFERR